MEPIQDAAGAVDRLAGAAVQASLLRTDDAVRGRRGPSFSYLTAEFEMKWGHIEREARHAGVRARRRDRGVRAGARHPGQGTRARLARRLAGLAGVADARRAARGLRDHIHDEVGRYRGRVVAWDVVNEAIAENGGGLRDTVFLRKLGPGYLADAFRWAREADPDVLLVYNDYGGEGLNRKSDDVYELVSGLVREGAPIGRRGPADAPGRRRAARPRPTWRATCAGWPSWAWS